MQRRRRLLTTARDGDAGRQICRSSGDSDEPRLSRKGIGFTAPRSIRLGVRFTL